MPRRTAADAAIRPTRFPPPLYQSFVSTSDRRQVAPRLAALREEMTGAGLDAFLVPRADAHRGEAVPPSEARLAWLTGFTGSAGLAVIGARKAALFVDSRYTLQAAAETDTRKVKVHQIPQASVPDTVMDVVPKGGRIGYDPWLHTPGEIKDLAANLEGRATLAAVPNLIDRIWPDRPAPPVSEIEFLGDNRAGKAAPAKLADLRKAIGAEGADAVILTLPESICWLFNVRAQDVPHTPFLLGFAIVPKTGQPTLYLDRAKITPDLRMRLKGIAKVADSRQLVAALRRLGAADRTVMVDPATVPVAVVEALHSAGDPVIVERRDPVLLPKSRKNDAELGGMRDAHRLDGVAIARFLAWFDAEAPGGQLTEIDVVTALEAFRREELSLTDVSFDTIAGAGPNGAIIHYRVNETTNRRLAKGDLMLVDSGAQYHAGTTDITRTLATGRVTAEQKDRFTRVLKGMMAIATARFPRGTSGAQLDALARQFLWQAGVTYEHGTGHGVGAYLSVHEGPTGLSPRYTLPLEPGMVLSDEPGFYKPGAYGIRIENLVAVTESSIGDGKFLEFETLTLAPIDLRLVDGKLLTADERAWLNAYHKRVWTIIAPSLQGSDKAWLKQATQPI